MDEKLLIFHSALTLFFIKTKKTIHDSIFVVELGTLFVKKNQVIFFYDVRRKHNEIYKSIITKKCSFSTTNHKRLSYFANSFYC